jgi:hypothetical protein
MQLHSPLNAFSRFLANTPKLLKESSNPFTAIIPVVDNTEASSSLLRFDLNSSNEKDGTINGFAVVVDGPNALTTSGKRTVRKKTRRTLCIIFLVAGQ